MAMAAERIERVFFKTPAGSTDVLVKWQTIQDNLAFLGPNALRDFMAELLRNFMDSENVATPEVIAVLDSWFRRALFAAADHERPVNPHDKSEWLSTETLWR